MLPLLFEACGSGSLATLGNVTYDELTIGQTAAYSKTIRERDDTT